MTTTTTAPIPDGTAETPLPWPPADQEQRLRALRVATVFHPVAGTRDTEIRRHYRISSARFWQVVNQLVDLPEVMAAMPLECARLRRTRTTLADARAARRNGSPRA